MTLEEAINICKEIIKTNMFNRNTDAEAIEEVLNTMYKSIEDSAYYRDLVKLERKEKEQLKKSLKGQIAVKDTEINKLNNVIDLMSRAILNYDDQLVINHYRDKEHVKETFTEYAMKEDK